MGTTRRKFTDEYKAEAIELVISSGRSVPEIARNLGISIAATGAASASSRVGSRSRPADVDEAFVEGARKIIDRNRAMFDRLAELD